MSAIKSSPSLLGDGGSSTSISKDVPAHNGLLAKTASAPNVDDIKDVSAASIDAQVQAPAARPHGHKRTATAILTRGISQPQNADAKDRDQPEKENDEKDGAETKYLGRTSSSNTQSNVALDPLSTQIYLRTNSNTETPSITQRLRNPTRADSPGADGGSRPNLDVLSRSPNGHGDPLKDRRKGPSFLSRFAMRGAFKKDDDALDSDSDLGELRTEGSSARALTSIVGAGGGFIPFYKEPPRYIRVRAHNKKTRDFNHLFLAQELSGTRASSSDEERTGRTPQTAVGKKLMKAGDAIWAAEFSTDGKYLAVAGKDQIVRVFAVLSTPEERKAHEEEESLRGADGERLSAPVFHSTPVREFAGHTGEVLALSWSKNNFLLSSSMDKTVRLWHMSRADCLCTFKHSDLVTSICFHPTDDRFFIAGSLDAQLRLWSIPDKNVAFSVSTTEFITAVGFAPDGKTAICGLLSGLCIFYETEGLKSLFQIHVRSSRGKNAKGSKITGIRTATAENGDVKVLITSNDSRVRVYNLRTRMLEVKFKGLENQSSQINARFSDDGKYVICGSEDRKTYIWGLDHPEAELKDKQTYECFDAHPEVVTTALMAPMKSRQLLSGSEDPIYELCNPPPVMLRSLGERTTSQSAVSDTDSQERRPSPPLSARRPEESPGYIKRSKHMDGNIIVTTDRTGTIKVFRQDCAFNKRQQNSWETGSKLSGKMTGIRRSGSIVTRNSTGSRAQSRRGSLNLGAPQHASDRIMSWRQDIESGRASLGGSTPTRSERSLSPSKVLRTPLNNSGPNLASDARKLPYVSSPTYKDKTATSPTVENRRRSVKLGKTEEEESQPTKPPTPGFSLIPAKDVKEAEPSGDKAEGGFWSLGRWKGSIPSLRLSSPVGFMSNASTTDGSPMRSSIDATSPVEERHDKQEKPGRRSIGVGALNRLWVTEETTDRRKSTSILPSTRSSSVDSRVPHRGEESSQSSKKRTDSGVGRMSSSDSNDEASGSAHHLSCQECGSTNLKTKSVHDDHKIMSCAKCGTLTSQA